MKLCRGGSAVGWASGCEDANGEKNRMWNVGSVVSQDQSVKGP
jgi:hypothetical protein